MMQLPSRFKIYYYTTTTGEKFLAIFLTHLIKNSKQKSYVILSMYRNLDWILLNNTPKNSPAHLFGK